MNNTLLALRTAYHNNKKYLLLAPVLCALFLGLFLLETTKTTARTWDYGMKAEASSLAAKCFSQIKALKAELHIPIDPSNDPNRSGMIGQDYSDITTTLGNLEAKRTSVNPNMAAAIVDMFHELGLQAGDRVAVNCSGSFPALNIAVLCAAEVMDLNPIMISSIGASTHGANDPGLTYLDMEYDLFCSGTLSNRSAYFSIGGDKDIGSEMKPEVKAAIVARLRGYGYELLYDDDLMHNILTRYALYQTGGKIQCFVNVGGNDASFGDSSVMVHADGGILTSLAEKDNSTGLVQLFLKDGMPVVHLLNVKSIAVQYGLPIDPTPLPQIGEGGVYYTREYNKALAAGDLFLACLAIFLIRRINRRG